VHRHHIYHSPLTGVTAARESLFTIDKAQRAQNKYILLRESPMHLTCRGVKY